MAIVLHPSALVPPTVAATAIDRPARFHARFIVMAIIPRRARNTVASERPRRCTPTQPLRGAGLFGCISPAP